MTTLNKIVVLLCSLWILFVLSATAGHEGLFGYEGFDLRTFVILGLAPVVLILGIQWIVMSKKDN